MPNGFANGWSKLNKNPNKNETKDVVFMLGENLKQGPQTFTEIKVPYEGTINNLLISIGSESDNQSNLIINLEKLMNSDDWVILDSFDLQTGEEHKEFPTNFNINNDKLRITLVSGDFDNVTTMSIIAQLNVN